MKAITRITFTDEYGEKFFGEGPARLLPHSADPDVSLGCVIMASGLGKRFGGNKLMADFHGEPMISRALAATEGIFAQRIVVTRHKDVADFCQDKGVPALLHDLPYRSDTVRLGLESLDQAAHSTFSDHIQGCMFCPGDQPLLRHETIAELAVAAQNDPHFIWRVAFEGTPGTPVLFPEWAFSELKSLPQGKGGGYLAKKYPEQVRLVPVRDWYELKDVDTPEDLSALLKLQDM